MLFAASTAGTTTTWLDPVVIGIILSSVALGFFRGLLRSAAGLLGLILAAIFAGRLAALIDPSLDQAHIQHPPVAGGVAFVIAFVAIVVAVEFAAGLLRRIQRLMFLGWLDRLGAALSGLVRGILISMILLAGFAMVGSREFNSTMRQAQVAVTLWQNVSGLVNMLPSGMRASMIRLVHDQAPFLADSLPTG